MRYWTGFKKKNKHLNGYYYFLHEQNRILIERPKFNALLSYSNDKKNDG